jgi:predicted RNA-binding protein with PIN domain
MPSRRRTSAPPRSSAKPLPTNLRPKHLIVDGYNLIHSQPELKKVMQRFGSDMARDELHKLVAILHDFDGWRMTVVFDGRGESMSVEYPLKHRSYGTVFTPAGISADEVIEGLVANAAGRDDLVVATSDGGIRLFIQTQGARWLPAEELWRWVDEANDSMRRTLSTRAYHPQRRFIEG